MLKENHDLAIAVVKIVEKACVVHSRDINSTS